MPERRSAIDSRALPTLALLGILALAAWLRFEWGAPTGERLTFLRNDEQHYTRPVVQFLNGNWRVDDFINPTLPMYLMYVGVVLVGWWRVLSGEYDSFADFVYEATVDPYWTTVVGRWITSAAGVLGVYLTYVVGRRLFGRAVGLVAALALALNTTHVHRSVLAGNETLLVVFALAFFLALHAYVERPAARRHAACGILLGLAATTKYNGAIHAVTLAGATLLVFLRGRRAARVTPGRAHLLPGLVAAPLAFCAGSPGIVTNFGRFVEDFRTQATFLHGGWDEERLGWHYYAVDFARGNAGTAFALLCIAGLLLAAWRALRDGDPRCWLLLLASLPCYLVLGSGIFSQMRFLLPAIPFLLVLGAWALTSGVQWTFERRRSAQPGPVAAGLALLLAAAFLSSHFPRVHAVSRGPFSGSDDRAELREWLLDSIDPEEPCLDVASFSHCGFYSAPAVLRAAPPDESPARAEIRQRLLARSLRTLPLLTIAQREPDFPSFKRALEQRRERLLILSLWSHEPLREPVDVRSRIPGLLMAAARPRARYPYWRKAARAISRWRLVDYRIGSGRQRVVCIVELPRAAGDSLGQRSEDLGR